MRARPPARFPRRCSWRAAGKAFNTVPPSDFGFFELMNEVVQDEPAGSTDAELLGQLAAIGIVKGEPFEPDERMRRILEDAAAVGSRDLARAVLRPASIGGVRVLRRLGVVQHAVGRRLHVRDAAAAGHEGGDQAVPRDRRPEAALADRRSCTRPPGSRPRCACGSPESGRSTSWRSRTPTATARRREDLPGDAAAGHPGGALLVAHPLRQRDALDARRRRSASRGPAASPTRRRRRPRTPTARRPSRSVRSGPTDSPEGNWIQTTEGKGWFPILRLYSPLEPFFDKTWRPSEIEVVE